MEKKKVKYFDDYGFGFQVRIVNAPMLKVRGEWVLDLDASKLQQTILRALASKAVRLTGSEIRFVRHSFDMTSTAFGEKFNVSHAAVLKWEKAGQRGTGMNWSTEKDIRLFVAARVFPKASDFLAVYQELEERAEDSAMVVKIDAEEVA